MGELIMMVGAVDIGTNSMRLLITDGDHEVGRWTKVTGLGRGVDHTGLLSDEAVRETVKVLAEYGDLMNSAGVIARGAIATSASRDASNRDLFFDQAEEALGVRPELITGEEEASFAFSGAAQNLNLPGPVVVSDIGGGSTEFVGESHSVSVDIGSVRLTERSLGARPPADGEVEQARSEVIAMFQGVALPVAGTLVGVAGTWASLSAIAQAMSASDRDRVHGHVLTAADLDVVIDDLSMLTVEETASIPSLDPKRAPVILAGAVVAASVLVATSSTDAFISGRDTLDGLADKLLALA